MKFISIFPIALFFTSTCFAQHSTVEPCPRIYPPGIQSFELRLIDQNWQIGYGTPSDAWAPLLCTPDLENSFYDPSNQAPLNEDGEGNVGKTASIIFYPSEKVPEGVNFYANPQNLFTGHRIEVPLPGTGVAFLDNRKYQQWRKTIRGLHVEIDSEADSPAKKFAIQTIKIYTQLFPHHSKAMSEHGRVTIVLTRNSTEQFQSKRVRANGLHDPTQLFSVLFSQDGVTGVLQHSFHEIGGLFRALNRKYSQGQTWMASYDLMEKTAPTAAAKKLRACVDVQSVIQNIEDTGALQTGNLARNIESYIENNGQDGWPMYAWGSAYYWKLINRQLEDYSLTDVYQLIDSVPEDFDGRAPSVAEKELDQWIADYQKINLSHSEVFEKLALRYFREKSLADLLKDAQAREIQLHCAAEN